MTKESENSPVEGTPADDLMLASDRFWEENKTLIITAAAALIIAGIAVSIWFALSEKKQMAAQEAFANAKTAEQLEAVTSDFSGTVAADNSLLLLAKIHRDAGDKAAAESTYQAVLAQKDYPLVSTAALAEAELSSKGEGFAKRADTMRQLALNFPDSYVAPYALLMEGEFLLGGNEKENAVKVFKNLAADYPTSLSGQMAIMQAQRLSDQNSLLTTPAGQE